MFDQARLMPDRQVKEATAADPLIQYRAIAGWFLMSCCVVPLKKSVGSISAAARPAHRRRVCLRACQCAPPPQVPPSRSDTSFCPQILCDMRYVRTYLSALLQEYRCLEYSSSCFPLPFWGLSVMAPFLSRQDQISSRQAPSVSGCIWGLIFFFFLDCAWFS